MESMVSEVQKGLVISSFVTVMDEPESFANQFYQKLFELDPSLKPMFKGDMIQQGRKLMQTLSVVVNAIYNLESVIPAVEALGKRHVQYGVKQSHYATVGAALLMTLEEALGDEFTP